MSSSDNQRLKSIQARVGNIDQNVADMSGGTVTCTPNAPVKGTITNAVKPIIGANSNRKVFTFTNTGGNPIHLTHTAAIETDGSNFVFKVAADDTIVTSNLAIASWSAIAKSGDSSYVISEVIAT